MFHRKFITGIKADLPIIQGSACSDMHRSTGFDSRIKSENC
jgi:hypothetical protein